jgi:hypothetical protein
MSEWRPSIWRNPAAWYTTFGMLLLAFSLYIPWLTASRTTRVEERADQIAEALLLAAGDVAPAWPLDEGDLQVLLARFHAYAERERVYVNDLERVASPSPGAILCLVNKHYAVQLAESPPLPDARVGQGTVPALEVTAWPLSAVGPGLCAFFYPENAERAFSRNLRAGYAGFGRRPMPGDSHRHGDNATFRTFYSGRDDERWNVY